MRRRSLLLAVVLLAGCGILPLQEQKRAPLSLAESLQQAEQLRKEGRYSSARQQLMQAKKAHPDHPGLEALLQQILTEQRQQRQRIEDQLLAARLTLVQQQRPLLAQLAKSEADDPAIRSRLQQLERTWRESRPLLSRCGERQLHRTPATAERCLRLALAIDAQQADRERLAQIEQKRARSAKKAQQKRNAARVRKLLEQARRKQKRGEHYAALMLLEQLLELAPGSTPVANLKKTIQQELARHTERLLTAGEALYQSGEPEGAITIWNTLLLIDPQHEGALQKIQRARRVLENLQQLRQQQKTHTHPAHEPFSTPPGGS